MMASFVIGRGRSLKVRADFPSPNVRIEGDGGSSTYQDKSEKKKLKI